MSLILGFTSLFVAFVALWFASEALKGTRKGSQALIRAQTAKFAEAIGETNRVVNDISQRVEHLEKEIADMGEGKTAARKALADLERRKRTENATGATAAPATSGQGSSKTGTG